MHNSWVAIRLELKRYDSNGGRSQLHLQLWLSFSLHDFDPVSGKAVMWSLFVDYMGFCKCG